MCIQKSHFNIIRKVIFITLITLPLSSHTEVLKTCKEAFSGATQFALQSASLSKTSWVNKEEAIQTVGRVISAESMNHYRVKVEVREGKKSKQSEWYTQAEALENLSTLRNTDDTIRVHFEYKAPKTSTPATEDTFLVNIVNRLKNRESSLEEMIAILYTNKDALNKELEELNQDFRNQILDNIFPKAEETDVISPLTEQQKISLNQKAQFNEHRYNNELNTINSQIHEIDLIIEKLNHESSTITSEAINYKMNNLSDSKTTGDTTESPRMKLLQEIENTVRAIRNSDLREQLEDMLPIESKQELLDLYNTSDLDALAQELNQEIEKQLEIDNKPSVTERAIRTTLSIATAPLFAAERVGSKAVQRAKNLLKRKKKEEEQEEEQAPLPQSRAAESTAIAKHLTNKINPLNNVTSRDAEATPVETAETPSAEEMSTPEITSEASLQKELEEQSQRMPETTTEETTEYAEAQKDIADTKPAEEMSTPEITSEASLQKELEEQNQRMPETTTTEETTEYSGLASEAEAQKDVTSPEKLLLGVRRTIKTYNPQAPVKVTDLRWYEEVRGSEAFLNIFKAETGLDTPPSKREMDQMFKELVDRQNEGEDIGVKLDSARGLGYFLFQQS